MNTESSVKQPGRAVYRCVTKSCPQYRVEFTGMTPADYSMATGKRASCKRCYQTAQMVRVEIT